MPIYPKNSIQLLNALDYIATKTCTIHIHIYHIQSYTLTKLWGAMQWLSHTQMYTPIVHESCHSISYSILQIPNTNRFEYLHDRNVSIEQTFICHILIDKTMNKQSKMNSNNCLYMRSLLSLDTI